MIRIGIANLHNENHYTRLFPFSPYYAEIMLKMKKAYNPSYTAQTVGFKPLYLSLIHIWYLSGSVLYSYLLPKALKGIDITAESPDGNPGTANAFTCAGIPIGILVLCMELLKGYLPVHLALREVNPARWSFALILAAPVFGHACPFFQPQKGGKAIAVSFGVLRCV